MYVSLSSPARAHDLILLTYLCVCYFCVQKKWKKKKMMMKKAYQVKAQRAHSGLYLSENQTYPLGLTGFSRVSKTSLNFLVCL